MKTLAIIPARGGSKRIPKKNIRDFLGKPIIAYSIQTALESELFDEVMVSTEDQEIAKIAEKYGAKIPFYRSKSTSDDYSTLADVVDEVIDMYETKNMYFTYGCCILPTAPLLSVSHLKRGYDIMKKKDIDSVKPVVRYSFPIQRALKMDEDHRVSMFYPEYKNTRSQDLTPAYYDAGQFYWFRAVKRMRGLKKFGIEIDPINAQDIDTEDDWKIAELKYKMMSK